MVAPHDHQAWTVSLLPRFSGAAPSGSAPGGFAFGAKYIGQVASVLPAAAAPTLQAAEVPRAAIIPADLDGELSQQLQKLSKRDATTKLKALQALGQLVKEKDVGDIKQAVPPWAYLYGKLVMDNSRAVRAETSQVMGALAAALGRSLAPFLRSLVPSWWLGQFDTHVDAAAAARTGFVRAFPAAKQRDVLLFCRAELLQLLKDNLSSTPQSLGDPKKEAPEDLQERHERVLAATCAAAGALVDLFAPAPTQVSVGDPTSDEAIRPDSLAPVDSSVGSAGLEPGNTDGGVGSKDNGARVASGEEAFLEGLGALLRQPALSKGVLQSKAPGVRRAGYSLVAVVARRCPGLLQDYITEGAPVVLGALSDKDPSNHSSTWDAILSFAKAYPQAWDHINMAKAFLPRLWALLRHACYGSAESSLAAVLPLITLLPKEVLGPSPMFFTSLLTSVWDGLEASSDGGARKAAADCFKECLVYALLKAELLTQGSVAPPADSSTTSGSSSVDYQLPSRAQQFCREILDAVLPQTVLPAATALGGDAGLAELALGALCGPVATLAGTAGPATPAGAPPAKLRLLLQVVGGYLTSAAKRSVALQQGQQQQGQQEQELHRQIQDRQEGRVPERAAVAFERVTGLVTALADAAGSQQVDVGNEVCRPLIAMLLPEVRNGSVQPAAASLLATLLKRFPQHAAAVPAMGAEGAAAGDETLAAASSAGAAAEGSLVGEMSALRLHQSASFTIESLLRRCVSHDAAHDEAALAASCDLLLSCLGQVADPGRKFGEVLLQLWSPASEAGTSAAGGSGGSAAPQLGAALMLVKHLVAGGHAGLSVAECRLGALDQAAILMAAALTAQQQQRRSGPAVEHSSLTSIDKTAELLALLLVGDDSSPLLSASAQAKVLAQLLGMLEAAVPADPSKHVGLAADCEAVVAALEIVQDIVLAIPAAVPGGSISESAGSSSPVLAAAPAAALVNVSSAVVDLELRLLAAVFRLLVQHCVAAAAEHAVHVEEEEQSVASSSEEEEEEEGQAQLGRREQGEAARQVGSSVGSSQFLEASSCLNLHAQYLQLVGTSLAEAIWSQGPRILTLMQAASHTQRAALAADIQAAVLSALEQVEASTAEAAPSPATETYHRQAHGASAAALDRLANLVMLVLPSCCGQDLVARQQFLQPLLAGSSSGAAEGGTAAAVRRYSPAHAEFLVALASKAGFDALLGQPHPSPQPQALASVREEAHANAAAGPNSAAAVALGILAALAGASCSYADEGRVLQGVPVITHLIEEASSGSPALLAGTLAAAYSAAVESEQAQTLEEEQGPEASTGGSMSNRSRRRRTSASLVVLCQLLRAAANSSSAAAEATAARSFAEHIAGMAGSAAPAPLPVVLAVVPKVAPAFRSSKRLLEESGLPALTSQLCAAYGKGSSRYAMLAAVVSCFPTPAVPPTPSQQVQQPKQAGAPAELAAQPAAANGSSSGSDTGAVPGTSSIAKGDAVWYLDRSAAWQPAKVVAVDTSHHPPSYSIQLPGGSIRETEANRLQPRDPTSSSAPPAASNAAPEPAVPGQEAAAAAPSKAASIPGSQGFTAPVSTEAERAALLAVIEAQWGSGAATPAGAGQAAGSNRDSEAAGQSGPPETGDAHAAATAELALRVIAYCWRQLSQSQWSLLLSALTSGCQSCCSLVEGLASEVAAALAHAAAAVAGAELGSVQAAVQFWRRLQQKGVVEHSQKAMTEASRFTEALQAALASSGHRLLPLLRSWLQAYAIIAAIAPQALSLPVSDWQAAEAAACSDALQSLVGFGALVGLASAAGSESEAVLGAWLGQGQELGDSWQELLGAQVLGTLRAADGAYLEVALARANGLDASTGSDAVGSLLSLALSGAVPHSLAAAAYEALLLHPALLGSLSAAGGVSEEELEQSEIDSSDSVAMLEQVTLRPELASAVANPSHPALLPAWALLVAHILAQPADSGGRRLLVQTLKDAHTVVPGVLGALVPLLPLGNEGAGKRSGRSAPAAQSQPAAAAASSGGSTGCPAPSPTAIAAAQFLALGLPNRHGQQHVRGQSDTPPGTQQLAVLLYSALLQALPASARLWFSDLRDRGTSAAVERYTAASVSGGLLAAEFAAVMEAALAFGKSGKFSARANPTSREVIAAMEVEDGQMLELVVKLPTSMPLRPPAVGVSDGRLRKWLLSIDAFLRTQNGSVAEAVSLWKRNVEKEFEGQEECLICYSILQPTNQQLPRLSCRTCRKKFHGACLFKWFKSSGKSACPHCQSPW
ncbi:hypothetical protein N2152v2_008014 [Parachlorella kessleri]